MDLYNEKGETASLYEVVDWWLEHYEGLEHMTEGGRASPETWFTINTVLRRCFEKIHKPQASELPTDVEKSSVCDSGHLLGDWCDKYEEVCDKRCKK